MNNKGFTLTELIIVVAIMGLIAVIAFPAIVDLQKQQKDAKYYAYEDAAIETAKLYTDQVKDDIGGKEGCFTITKDQLVATGLLDEFKDAATTECDFEIQYIIATDGKEDYKIKMWCKTTDLEEYPDGILYDNRDKVTFDDPATCQPTVPDGDYCRYTEKKYEDEFGSCINASNNEISCGGGVQTRSYTLVSIYDNNIDCANNEVFTETRSCNTHACLEANTLNASGISYPGSLDVKLTFNHTNGREMLITVNNSSTPDINDPRWETINTNKAIDLKNYGISTLAGQQIKIYVFVKDVYGNIKSISDNYDIHSECDKLIKPNGVSAWSTCSATCDGGTQTRQLFYKDTYTGNACPNKTVTSDPQSCNTHSCLTVSGLNITTTEWYNGYNVNMKFNQTAATHMIITTSSTAPSAGDSRWQSVNTNINLNIKTINSSITLNGTSRKFYVFVKDKNNKVLSTNATYTVVNECSSTRAESYWEVQYTKDTRPVPWSKYPDVKIHKNVSNYTGETCGTPRREESFTVHNHKTEEQYCVMSNTCYVTDSFFRAPHAWNSAQSYYSHNCNTGNYSVTYNGSKHWVMGPEYCNICGEPSLRPVYNLQYLLCLYDYIPTGYESVKRHTFSIGGKTLYAFFTSGTVTNCNSRIQAAFNSGIIGFNEACK